MDSRRHRALAHIALLLLAASLPAFAIGGPEARVAYFALLNRAGERYEAGDYEGAAEDYGEACGLNLSSLGPRIKWARALNRLGRHAQAAAVLEAAARYGADNPDLRAGRAEAALGLREPDIALEMIEPVVKAYPAASPARRIRGLALIMLGRDEAGLADLNEAVRLAPGDPDGAQALARYYLDRNQPDKAIAILRRLQQSSGGDPRTVSAVAEAEGALGDPHAAAAALLTRASAPSRAALGRLLSALPPPVACPAEPAGPDELLACGRFAAARAALDARAMPEPGDGVRLARACLWLGDRPCAAAGLRAEAARDPARAPGLLRLAGELEKP